jgi:hypothetical protein
MSEENPMTSYSVKALPADLAQQVRETLKSPQYGHPVYAEMATGYGPCRSCLRKFRAGSEERLLFTYNPFAGWAPLPLPGPIFIHREDCSRYENAGFPPELVDLPLVLDAYDKDGWCLSREPVRNSDVEGAIERIFAKVDVEYIHVRNAEAGCFIARIERS